MKRCPLCDFIYEDDQGVCEMDGIELAHESEVLIPAGEDIPLRSVTSTSSARRRRPLYLLLGFGLGAAIFSAYYTSVNQAAPAGGGQTSASYSGRPEPPALEPTPATVAPTPSTATVETAALPAGEPTPPLTPTAPTTKPRAASTGGRKARAGSENKKKESKLASVLNKTGRMLKKPFGF